ncbi:MAG: hypothetical protein GF344_14695 [Chitinivibrionales bacterium]|nr:hypothetical protein [Chitinivibrionales bacterium]MBD3357965.1 hypothetical protein [Chitinivibrionales bacterium]
MESKGMVESSEYDGQYEESGHAYLSPVLSLASYMHIGNSIFYHVNNKTEELFDFRGRSTSAHLANIVQWEHTAATPTEHLYMDNSVFGFDPSFEDTTLYFLPDSTSQHAKSTNGAPIGYGGYRFDGNGPYGDDAPPPVNDLVVKVTGSRQITVTWSPPSETKISQYRVYRVPGDDSLFYVAPDGSWELSIPEDSIFAVVDSFSTTNTFFIDTTAKRGQPYIYAVVAVNQYGDEGMIDMPYPPPLADYKVMLPNRPSPIATVSAQPTGPRSIKVSWPAAPENENVGNYILYRIVGKQKLFFINDESQWEPRPVAFEQGLIDSFIVDKATFSDTTVRMGMPYVYRVAAINSHGSVGRITMPSSVSFDGYVVEIGATTRIALEGDTWHMIGPVGLDTLLLGSSPDRYLYTWNDLKAEDGIYSRYEPARTMAPSQGYWIWSAHDTILTYNRDRLQAAFDTARHVAVTLEGDSTGWNQISSPFPFTVAPRWRADFELFGWNTSVKAYESAQALEPGRAYWIQVERDTVLPIPAQPAPSNSTIAKWGRLAKRAAGLSWELRISLEGDGWADRDNYIGVLPNHLAKAVSKESGEPPPAFDYPQLYFVRMDDSETVKNALRNRLSRQYKICAPLPKEKLEWTVAVSPSATAATVHIDGLDNIPSQLHLFWVTQKEAIDIRERTKISIPAHNQKQYAYIVATADPSEITRYSTPLELLPPYPNPFVHTTTLQFNVPYAWNGTQSPGGKRHVSIRIYDIDGRLIATPVSHPLAVGPHRLVWDARTAVGAPAPAGYYVARLVVGEHAKAVRLLKVR